MDNWKQWEIIGNKGNNRKKAPVFEYVLYLTTSEIPMQTESTSFPGHFINLANRSKMGSPVKLKMVRTVRKMKARKI